MDAAVRAHTWIVDPSEIPASEDERADWLSDWWQRVDAWIGAPGTEG